MANTKDIDKKTVRKILHGDGIAQNNSRGRGRSPEEKRASYAKYRATKKKAIELEKRNTQYLVLWPASDVDTNKEHKFYNMGGVSAIIYVHEIGPRIKKKPVLRRDMDSCNDDEKFHSGVCSVANLEALGNRLAQIGVKRVKNAGDLVFFKLTREYLADEIKAMLRSEQERLDSLNKLLYSQVLYPDIHRQILELKKLVPVKVKNMDKTYREVIGMEMIKSLMVLVRSYTQMAHGDIEQMEAAREMLLETDMLMAEVSIFNELKIWEVSTCLRVGEIVVGLRQLIKGRIINKEQNPETSIKKTRSRYEAYK